MKGKWVAKNIIAGCIFAACGSSVVHAGSELQPGISTGLPLGLPLPPGLYGVGFNSYGWRGDSPTVGVGAVAPWLIWSTPWTIAGGRLILDTVTGFADVDVKGHHSYTGSINPLLDAQLKWNLGGGLSAGIQGAVFLPIRNNLTALGATNNFFSFVTAAAVTYERNGWEFDATGFYGSGKNGDTLGENAAPSWTNYDLTALKRVGPWEFGAVAFGSHDLSSPIYEYQRQSQFAMGGLIGYKIGKDTIQLKVTRDFAESNYSGRETRIWLNFILPLWVQK
ncbi:transporter [Burkholderia vietnamiensis]|uniref:Transporter n=2 Tax=Burkholderia vietnamiensis TaxID=60552 RepID=A0AAW7SY81_BURVI|nr:transporter [Burkholderia vietnamiensis]MDN7551256.1 transporter [Burkholderia vietnamiensis]MDN7795070.1 transporter [Burkholderia vietnamiensis]MDN8044431.1 transporter [Burkholderia vietnamiensis]MDN8073793.1 transporter [Burkholderia vietnamiensis]HDR8982619.1 transporter [Burkholderia vietnamiensis]